MVVLKWEMRQSCGYQLEGVAGKAYNIISDGLQGVSIIFIMSGNITDGI